MKNQFKTTTINLDLRGTKQFYSAVRILNRQVGRGNWTTRGRPVRKLRRLERIASIISGPCSMIVEFRIPDEYRDIGTLLVLGEEA